MRKIELGAIIYTATGNPCSIEKIDSESIDVATKIVTKVLFDGITTESISYRKETFKFDDYGTKWFYNVEEGENYLITKQEELINIRIKENAPKAPKLTESTLLQLRDVYLDRDKSTKEEKDFLNYVNFCITHQDKHSNTQLSSPYFARMDFQTIYNNESYYDKIYIGKESFKTENDIIIYDWRSPIGELYYDKTKTGRRISNGNYHYDYNMLLRRRIEIDNTILVNFNNEFIYGDLPHDGITDDFLVEILRARANTPGMKDIILTIQRTQNEIIRQPLNTNMIIQGCAGSGKTMVMLHRLSYLKFHNSGLDFRRIRIITPSHHFDVAVNDLAESLKIKDIPIMNVQEYYFELLSRYELKIEKKDRSIASESSIDESNLAKIYSADYRNILRDVYDNVITEEISKYSPQLLEKASIVLGYNFKEKPNSTIGIELIRYYNNAATDLFYLNSTAVSKCQSIQSELAIICKKLKDHSINADILKTRDQCRRLAELIAHYDAIVNRNAELVELERVCENLKQESQRLNNELDSLSGIRFVKRRNLNSQIGFATNKLINRSNHVLVVSSEIARQKEILNNKIIMEDCSTISGVRKRYAQNKKILDQHMHQFSDYEKLVGIKENLEHQLLECRKNILDNDLLHTVELSKSRSLPDINEICRIVIKKFRSGFINKLQPNLAKRFFKFDWYYLLIICLAHLGPLLKPDKMINIDEGQNLSSQEFLLLKEINGSQAVFNVYGDVNQLTNKNVGISNWPKIDFIAEKVYRINENYRNSIQITNFVNKISGLSMLAVGIYNEEVVRFSSSDLKTKFLEFVETKRQGNVVILKDEYVFDNLCERNILPRHKCNMIYEDDQERSDSKINVYSVSMVKGLEFQNVLVISNNMSRSEQYIASTRALLNLFYCV